MTAGRLLVSRSLLFCAIGFSIATPAFAQSRSPTDTARGELPDWSGWWSVGRPANEEWLVEPPPLKPGLLERFRALRTADDAGDPLRYCRPPQFTGFSDGFVGLLEFLFTPGRVTLTTESGLLRRIYTDGSTFPENVTDSNTGTSIGHWEGPVLVVETIGINPAARYPGPAQGSIPIGKNVRITERIFLKAPDTLQFEVVTEAPDVLSEPDRRTRLYSRVRKTIASEITFCADYDRSIDPATGKQRFDLTPPPDLPPPPR
jgi:hypothetical protein